MYLKVTCKGDDKKHIVEFLKGGEFEVSGKVYELGDKGSQEGKILQEINIRLAGFGGGVPDEDFTKRTEKIVKQFQKDYMKITPTGKVDAATLNSIDKFSDKWSEQISDYKCLCHSTPFVVAKANRCPGYGKGKSKEHPGIHRNILWSISALKFYLSEQTTYTYWKTSAGYRCKAHNLAKGRTSTNHMGKAIDIQYYENGTKITGKKQSNLTPLKAIRDDFYIKHLDAVSGWTGKKNHYRIEPIGIGKDQSYSWIHMDVSKYETKFLEDKFFVKEQNLIKGKSLNELHK
ncbi:peptidoglycan-binding domain-containing protein [Tenacibaculum ovolyticum]|uniref:peptidoglycan-binding domain-containing protein n=1 Tax=Tenacibaculum ovolyticum TaxID=104270 RepID=UPI0022F3C409|nr:peptidoglycan-binding domain-containing protein [Tenacibaculum ovolyticum]WBX78220.1 peptidoglycan-binding domain-containing protein [Tenacibaculum ovolyticum]